jgi:arsenite-transporting ATPase
VASTVGAGLPGLTLSAIDPVTEIAAYTQHVLREAGAGLDAHALALLEEDLRSPCTEEIAVFRAFARAVAGGEDGFVIVDTAPSGHTLLLLDAARNYHREVQRSLDTTPEDVAQFLPRLRDPAFTRMIVVTLPQATPVHEAAAVAADLHRSGITPYAWVVNQAWAATQTTDPLLLALAEAETPYLAEALAQSPRGVLVGWHPEPPVGVQALQELMEPEPVALFP